MPIVIDRSICDEVEGCNAINHCDSGALYFHKENRRIKYNKDLCCNCGTCAIYCGMSTIMYAESDGEWEEMFPLGALTLPRPRKLRLIKIEKWVWRDTGMEERLSRRILRLPFRIQSLKFPLLRGRKPITTLTNCQIIPSYSISLRLQTTDPHRRLPTPKS